MPHYLPLVIIFVFSSFLGLRRGAKGQALLTAVIVGSWLALGPVAPSILSQAKEELGVTAGGGSFPTLVQGAVLILACGVIWRLGSPPGNLTRALLGGLWGAANGLIMAYTFLPSWLLLAPPVGEGEITALGQRVAGGGFDPHPLVIGGIFVLIFVAVRAIRPAPPDMRDWFTRE